MRKCLSKNILWTALLAALAALPLTSARADDTPTPLPASPAALDVPPISDDQVTAAIARAADYLLKSRDPKTGTWEHLYDSHGNYYGGESSLILYTLLHVGQSVNDKRLKPNAEELQPAIKFVTTLLPKTTYVTSLQVSALALLPRRVEFNHPLDVDRKLLVDAQTKQGGYSYAVGKNLNADPDAGADASNTQYGLLGAWAVHDTGMLVPDWYWRSAEKWWRNAVAADGGWGYRPKDGAKVSMTAAGISSLLIATDQSDRSLRLEMRPDKDLDRGMAYLAKNFHPEDCDPYALYSVERAGLLSGYKFFERLNWFEAGAKHLIQTQEVDGSWRHTIWDVNDPRISTALSLLFLARGRNPVVFNKLQYEGNWHARPRDLANLAEQIGRQFERPFNWQAINMNIDPDEWLDAPAVLLTGNVDPSFTPAELQHLRDYIGSGGMVFSVAVGNAKDSAGFTEAVKKYAADLFGGKNPMRPLPPDHPLFGIFAKLKNPPAVLGLSNGVREMWLHCPEDLGAAWQLKDLKEKAAFELPANIYFYACGKEELRTKLKSTAIRLGREKPARTITMGRLQYNGNWDPEFGAWARFARVAEARFRTQLDTVAMTPENLRLDKARFLWMTGAGKFEFTDEQVTKLRTYLDAGGALVADAAGGDKAFSESFKALIAKLYPADPLEELDDRHSLFSGTVEDGADIHAIKFRPRTEAAIGSTTTPRLYGLNRPHPGGGKRLVILFSPYDLTCGIAGVRAWGVDGYRLDSAELLTRNIVLYVNAITRKP